MMIEREELIRLLDYDQETGLFRWRVAKKGIAAGTVAGSKSWHGYSMIRLNKRMYMTHRLAWFYVHGAWPAHDLDHINGVRDDNRWVNLREATRAENLQNQRKPKAGSLSGFVGVYFHKRARKWAAEIVVDRKKHYLGLFNCPTAAYLLGYLPAKRRLHEFGTI